MKKTTNYTTVRKKAKGVHMIHQNLLKKGVRSKMNNIKGSI